VKHIVAKPAVFHLKLVATLLQEDYDMKSALQIAAALVGLALSLPTQAQTVAGTFPKGELSTDTHHSGDIWLNELVVGDATFDPSIAQAVYGPGAKLNWHVHPAGQVLLITEGTGYYQEKGQPARIVHKGDIIKSAPGIEHWHAAAPNSTFAYIAVTPTSKGRTIWRSPVRDEEYKSVKP
jgi:quercetin dioxygenase-like cupin family protein